MLRKVTTGFDVGTVVNILLYTICLRLVGWLLLDFVSVHNTVSVVRRASLHWFDQLVTSLDHVALRCHERLLIYSLELALLALKQRWLLRSLGSLLLARQSVQHPQIVILPARILLEIQRQSIIEVADLRGIGVADAGLERDVFSIVVKGVQEWSTRWLVSLQILGVQRHCSRQIKSGLSFVSSAIVILERFPSDLAVHIHEHLITAPMQVTDPLLTILITLWFVDWLVRILIHDLSIGQGLVDDLDYRFAVVVLVWFILRSIGVVGVAWILHSKIVLWPIVHLALVIVTRKDLALRHIVFKLLSADRGHFILRKVDAALRLPPSDIV